MRFLELLFCWDEFFGDVVVLGLFMFFKEVFIWVFISNYKELIDLLGKIWVEFFFDF